MAKAFTISDLHIDYYLGGDPTKSAIKRLLEPHLCPADVLIVAGDISNYATASRKTIEALAEMYADVVWTIGNHDMVSHNNENSYTKIDRITNALVNTKNAHYMNATPIQLHSTLFGGSMGYCDFSYAEKHFGVSNEIMTIRWLTKWFDGRFWNIGSKKPLDVWADEYSKLSDCVNAGCDVMVSHFGPAAVKVDSRFHNANTGYFYFDGLNLLDQMENGSVWCFGHTHDYFIEEVNGVRLLCNPFGYPEEERNAKIPKEEFVFDV